MTRDDGKDVRQDEYSAVKALGTHTTGAISCQISQSDQPVALATSAQRNIEPRPQRCTPRKRPACLSVPFHCWGTSVSGKIGVGCDWEWGQDPNLITLAQK